MKYKQVTLYPTTFTLDVWWGKDRNQLNKCFEDKYGVGLTDLHPESFKFYNAFLVLIPLPDGENKMACVFDSIEPDLVLHECNHVLNELCHSTGLEIGYQSQEWNSYFLGYLCESIMDKKSFVKWESEEPKLKVVT